MSARLEIIYVAYRPSSCRHPAALLFESQSIHIISLSLNRSFDSMLLPKTCQSTREPTNQNQTLKKKTILVSRGETYNYLKERKGVK